MMYIFNNERNNNINWPYHGTALYVKKHHLTLLISKFYSSFLEYIVASIHFRDFGPVQVVVLYKFPACSLGHFKQESLTHLKTVVDTEKNLIVLGDFNFDLLSGHTSLLDFLKLNYNL